MGGRGPHFTERDASKCKFFTATVAMVTGITSAIDLRSSLFFLTIEKTRIEKLTFFFIMGVQLRAPS